MGQGAVDLELLFEEYFPAIVQFFVRRRFSPQVAQELAQETFLRAHKGQDGFRCEAHPRTWLYVIAGNVYRNEVRRRRADRRSAIEVSLDVNGRDDEAGAPVERQRAASVEGRQCEQAMARQRIELLKEAIRDLPPRMQQIFILRMDQGRKYDEIAELMAISIQTVKSQIHQARQRLRNELDDADREVGHAAAP